MSRRRKHHTGMERPDPVQTQVTLPSLPAPPRHEHVNMQKQQTEMPLASTPPRPTVSIGTVAPPVGYQLRQARNARGETVAAIAQWLRIKQEYLEALESGQHEQLPALTYATGFLRSYADYLGLDSSALREAFRKEMMDKLTPQLAMPQPLAEAKIPPLPVIFATSLVASLIVLGWLALNSQHRDTLPLPLPQTLHQEMPQSAPAPQEAPTSTAAASIPPSQSGVLAPPAQVEQHFGELEKPTRRTIRAKGPVWLTITDSKDNVLFSRLMQEGDTYHVPDIPGLQLTTGNADNLQLTDSKDLLPPLGKQGQVMRDIALDTLKP